MKTIRKNDFVIKLPAGAKNFHGQMLKNALLEYADTTAGVNIAIEKQILTDAIPIDSARKIFVDVYLKPYVIDSLYLVEPLNRKNGYIIEAQTINLDEYDFSSVQTYWLVGFYQHTPLEYYIVWTWCDRVYKPDDQKIMDKIVRSFKIIKR